MIKGICWRILFELANFCCWLTGGRGRPVKYFAFGANMDPRILAKRRIRAIETQDFVLHDHALTFSVPGPYEGMGFASVDPLPGDRTYGRLHTITAIDALRLDFYELVPVFGYYRRVWTEQNGERFFFYRTTSPREGLRPTAEYIEKLCAGYACAAHVPRDYVEAMRAREVLAERVFARDLGFAFPVSESLPPMVVAFLRAYDRRALGIFMKYLFDTSLFERFLRHHE